VISDGKMSGFLPINMMRVSDEVNSYPLVAAPEITLQLFCEG
jgi:hypothetical protein